MKILMVCLGNICRSPIAEGVMQSLSNKNNLNWQVESAGTNGLHNGESPHKHSVEICKKHDIDISAQISRKFTKADFDNYDVIYVMAKDVYNDVKKIADANNLPMQKVKYFLDAIYPNQNRDVTDPWYGGQDGYIDVYNEIAKCCNVIAENAKL